MANDTIRSAGFQDRTTTELEQKGWVFTGTTALDADITHRPPVLSGFFQSLSMQPGDTATTPRETNWVPRELVGWLWINPNGGLESIGIGCFIQFLLDGDVQGTLAFGTDGSITYEGAETQTIDAQIDWSVGHWIIVTANLVTDGSIRVSIDGVELMFYSGPVQSLPDPQWDQLRFANVGIVTTLNIDDLAWYPEGVDRIPEGYEVIDYANANGTPNDWSGPEGGAEYIHINGDQPGARISSIDAGEISVFAFPPLPYEPAQVSFVAIDLAASGIDATPAVNGVIVSDGISDFSDDVPLTVEVIEGFEQAWISDVATGNPWTEEAASNVLLGVRVVSAEPGVYAINRIAWLVLAEAEVIPADLFEDLLPAMAARGQALDFFQRLFYELHLMLGEVGFIEASFADLTLACEGMLDFFGALEGEPRYGISDDEYRRLIYIRRAAKYGKHSLPAIYQAIERGLGPTATDIHILRLPPASVTGMGDNADAPELYVPSYGRAGD